jgi:hypothetical protein
MLAGCANVLSTSGLLLLLLVVVFCGRRHADKPKKCSKKAKSGDKVSVHYTGMH